MKLTLRPVLLTLCIGSIVLSCRKTHDTTTPPPAKTADSTTHISYIYLASWYMMNMDSVRQIELILNDQSDNILLDTIAAVNTNIVADLKTSSTAVDMTVVTYQKQVQAFYIYTNRAINPAAWTVLPGSDSLEGSYPTLPLATTQLANIDYINPPITQIQPCYWTAYQNTDYEFIDPAAQNSLDIPFAWYSGTYAYLMFSNLALYNLHYVASAADTVDLSNINIAEKIQFPISASYGSLGVTLYGYPDTGSLASVLTLGQFNNAIGSSYTALVYPGKQSFEKYHADLEYVGNNIYCEYSDPWCDTVNPNPIVLDNSYYTISSSSNNDFSVQFNKQSPGYYNISCTGGVFNWSLNIPSDSTVIHPVNYLSSLKSKMLANQTLTSIRVSAFQFSFLVSEGQLVPYPITPETYSSTQPKPRNTPVVYVSAYL